MRIWRIATPELICNNYTANSNIVLNNNAGCLTLEDVTENCTVSLEEETNDRVLLYPNPTDGRLNFKGVDKIEGIQVFDAYGLVQDNIIIDQYQVDLSHLASGLYLIKIKLDKGSSEVFNIVKL